MKKQIIKISLICLGIAISTLAYGQGPKAAKKEAHKEVRAYVEQNIIPVMQPQRAALDKELSRQELQELENIRSGLKALKEQKREQMKAFKQEQKASGSLPQPSEAQIAKRRSMEKEHRLLMTRAWTIADAHEKSIYRLLDEVKSDRVQWREDLGDIKKKYREEMGKAREGNEAFKGRDKRSTQGKGQRPHARKQGPRGGKLLAIFNQPVAFLLWDGTLPEAPKEFKKQEGRDFKVFPNPVPAAGNNNIRFEVKKAGKVTISLINEDGVTLKTLLNEDRQAGTYTENFQLDQLPAGVYYYKVETPEMRQVKRVLID